MWRSVGILDRNARAIPLDKRTVFLQIPHKHVLCGIRLLYMYCLFSLRNQSSILKDNLSSKYCAWDSSASDIFKMLSISFIGHSKYRFCLYLLSPSTFPMKTLSFLPGYIIERSGLSNTLRNHCFCSSVWFFCGLPLLFTSILSWCFLAKVETTSFLLWGLFGSASSTFLIDRDRTMFESRTSWLYWRAHC